MHKALITVLLTVVNARKFIHDSPTRSKHEASSNSNEGTDQDKYHMPVDFKRLSKEGVGDGDFKQPFDGRTLSLVEPYNVDHTLQLIHKRSSKNIRRIPKKEPLIFLSPRDEMEYYKNVINATNKQKQSRSFDFSSILDKNLADPFANRRGKTFESKSTRKFPTVDKVTPRKTENITGYFQDNRFYKKSAENLPRTNWTTCEEFAKNAVFHPDDIVNTKWVPFFIWSRRKFVTTVTHTFSYPTKKNVQYYKKVFGPHYKNIDWGQPKLLLNERQTILLIAGDRKGLFYGIPDQELPKRSSFKNVILEAITLRLKIHDPYLAMMHCDDQYAAIMAEMGTEPKSTREAHLEAATLNFKGIGSTVRRDIEEEHVIANMEQNKKMEDEANRFIHVYKPTGDVDIKVRHA